MELQRGLSVANRYILGGKLGSGAFGTVYAATDRNNNNKVAIKFINLDKLKASNKTFMLEAVNTEYELLRKLHEDNADNPIVHSIPEYYSKFELVVEGTNCLCVVMEYIKGKTLEKMYKYNRLLNRQFDRVFLTRLAYSLFATLWFLHKNNTVHRDIKPENVIYDSDADRLVVIDYGFICSTEVQSTFVCKNEVGSLRYMAPEILLNFVSVSNLRTENKLAVLNKADVWSAGQTIAQLANLSEPYAQALSQDDLEEAMLNKQVDLVTSTGPDDSLFVSVINSALTFDYKKRPDAYDLALKLLPEIK